MLNFEINLFSWIFFRLLFIVSLILFQYSNSFFLRNFLLFYFFLNSTIYSKEKRMLGFSITKKTIFQKR